MKQMPVESFFACVGMPSRRAIARTSRFAISPSGNSTGANCRLRKPMQKVALVLGRIGRLEQFDARRITRRSPHARIVAGRNVIGGKVLRVVEKRAELDLAVAEDVGIRRAAGLVFAQEMGEYALAVLGREVDGLELDAEHVGYGRGID